MLQGLGLFNRWYLIANGLILSSDIQLIFNVVHHFWYDITESLLIKASSLMHTLYLCDL